MGLDISSGGRSYVCRAAAPSERGVNRLHPPEEAAAERGAEKLEPRSVGADVLGALLDWLSNRCQPPRGAFEVEGAWRGEKLGAAAAPRPALWDVKD